jgi:hypothetical protein
MGYMFRLIESSSGPQGTDPYKIASNALRDPQRLQYYYIYIRVLYSYSVWSVLTDIFYPNIS